MKDDTISRQAAIDVIATMQGLCTSKAALIQNSKIWQQIKALPSATIEADPMQSVTTIWTDGEPPVYAPVRHGKWKSHGDCGVTECSCCGWNIEECVGWNYCPNCGARMDGEDDGKTD